MTDTDLYSKIERGGDEEPTQAYCQYVKESDEETTKLYR
jgi:hypothetical protein